MAHTNLLIPVLKRANIEGSEAAILRKACLKRWPLAGLGTWLTEQPVSWMVYSAWMVGAKNTV